eukprot:4714674-Pyramimonas_sp.AAC.2
MQMIRRRLRGQIGGLRGGQERDANGQETPERPDWGDCMGLERAIWETERGLRGRCGGNVRVHG